MKKVWTEVKLEEMDVMMTKSGYDYDHHEGQTIKDPYSVIPSDDSTYVSFDDYYNKPFS